jgi:hypothetical protein
MGAVTGYAASFANDNAVPPSGLLNAYANLNLNPVSDRGVIFIVLMIWFLFAAILNSTLIHRFCESIIFWYELDLFEFQKPGKSHGENPNIQVRLILNETSFRGGFNPL